MSSVVLVLLIILLVVLILRGVQSCLFLQILWWSRFYFYLALEGLLHLVTFHDAPHRNESVAFDWQLEFRDIYQWFLSLLRSGRNANIIARLLLQLFKSGKLILSFSCTLGAQDLGGIRVELTASSALFRLLFLDFYCFSITHDLMRESQRFLVGCLPEWRRVVHVQFIVVTMSGRAIVCLGGLGCLELGRC